MKKLWKITYEGISYLAPGDTELEAVKAFCEYEGESYNEDECEFPDMTIEPTDEVGDRVERLSKEKP